MGRSLIDFGPQTTSRSLLAGDILCAEGEEGTDIYQIESGSLDVVKATAEGPLVIATQSEGSIVGEITYALGGTRTATLRAANECVVTVVPYDLFIEWQDANPDRAAELAAQARLRLNQTRASAVLTNLFGREHEDLIGSLVSEVYWQTLAPGDQLFEQGDDADAAHLIVAGRLQLTTHDEVGDLTLDREVGRGELVGELGIIEDAPRNASARAIRETTLASISRSTFERFTTEHPNLMLKIFREILGRLHARETRNDRARVVTVAVTAPDAEPGLVEPLVDAVTHFGSTLHLNSVNLTTYVRDVGGVGSDTRVAEFLHESDVAKDYVILETDTDTTQWSVRATRQSDRFVIVVSADPSDAEHSSIARFLDLLTDRQKASAWIVRLHPTTTSQPSGSPALLDRYGVAEVHNILHGREDHLRRIGRLATGNGRGVVLGGGGARGMAHIGALKALRESGLEYDRIAGASMGSIIAGFAAKDQTTDAMLDIASNQLTGLLDYTIPLVSLIKAGKMTEGMEKNFGGLDITDFWIPFYCVTTNLTRAELAIHRRGPVVAAVRASVAIPAVLPPVPIDGDLHVDGGVLDNVPVSFMRADNSIGAVIAIDVSPPAGPAAERNFGHSVSGLDALRSKVSRKGRPGYPDLGQTLMSSLLIGSSKAKNHAIEHGLVDLYLQLELSGVGLLKFENHADVAMQGYQSALPQIEAWLERNG